VLIIFDATSDERTWQDVKKSAEIQDEEQIKYLANKSFRFFINHVLGFNTDSPVIQNSIDFHENPEQYKQTDSDSDSIKAAIMAPRGHSKTFSWTIAPILWGCYKSKGKEILLTSASHSQSKDILEDIKRIIELNEVISHLKPSTENMAQLGDSTDIKDWQKVWKAEGITTTTDVTVKVKTFSDSIRSKHVDQVYCDDVLSSNMKKDDEKDVFYSVLSPIIENSGGLMQIVGTPLEHNDLLMELMEKDNFYTKRYKACDHETEEVLWPANWSYESLMDKKKEIGPGRFTREYMTSPLSVDEQFFDDKVIEGSVDSSEWMHNPNTDDYDQWQHVLGVDIALSDGKDADFSVFTVLGVAPSGKTFLVNMEREKGLSPSGIAEKINSLDNFYHFDSGLVEKNAIGEGVWKTIEKKCNVMGRVEPFDTTRKTRPEILSSLQAALSRGELRLHDFDALIREMRGFRMNKKGKLEGRDHDDTVMSLAIAYRCVDGGSVQTSFNIIGEDSVGSKKNSVTDENKNKESFSGANSSSPDIQLGIV